MDLMYATLLLHAEKKPINEENLKKVLAAAGANIDEAKIKATVAALEGVDIEEVISSSKAVAPVAKEEGKKEEEKKDEKKEEEEAAAGLGALFG